MFKRYKNWVEGLDWEQTSKAIAKGILDSQAYSSVVNKMGNEVDQKAKAEEKTPFDPLMIIALIFIAFSHSERIF